MGRIYMVSWLILKIIPDIKDKMENETYYPDIYTADNEINENGNYTQISSTLDNNFKNGTLQQILTWLILPQVVMSVFGNVLIVIVMNKPKNRHLTTSTYFCALAVSDLIFVAHAPCFSLLNDAFGVGLLDLFDRNKMLLVHKIIININSEISFWLLITITIDRLICVIYPHRSRQLCTVFKARVAVAVIVIAFVALNCFLVLVCVDINKSDGSDFPFVDAFPNGAKIMGWFDLSCLFIIPFIFNSVGTLVIVVALKRSEQLRRTSTTASRHHSNKISRNRSATLNLIGANIAFLITISPLNIFLLVLIYDDYTSLSVNTSQALKEVFVYIFEMNAGLNFYVYILSGTRFREDVNAILCRSNNREFKSPGLSSTWSVSSNNADTY